jgi:hypothetical protein
MAEEIVRIIDHPRRVKRVIIVRREDGRFTFRWQDRCGDEWGVASIDAGMYDSADTAEAEARQRVQWLKDLFH